MLEQGDTSRPSDAAIVAALTRIVDSPRFRDSPQIAGFLRYVVERTLAGKADQIKGYTIAVEALGRDASFDPNSQSIVRTEAARLRQELARYYADAGRDDEIRITLPLGRYVPTFTRHSPPEAAASELAESEAVDFATTDVAPIPPPAASASAAPADAPARHAFRVPTVGLVLIAVVVYALLDAFVIDGRNLQPLPGPRAERATASPWRRGEPRIAIAPVATVGPHAGEVIEPAVLQDELINALSRFEDIVVVATDPNKPETAPGTDPNELSYVLVPALSRAGEGQTILSLRLISMPDRAVVWHDNYAVEDSGTAHPRMPDRLLLDITSALLQPFGVIPAAERRKLGDRPSSPYHCVLDAAELARYFDPQLRERTRACLETAIRDDPGFAYGHVLLARLHVRDYMFGYAGPDVLMPAVALARRAVELSPTSARAHYTLMNVQVARGFVQDGLEHGEKALALNPYDVRVLMQVGGQLVTTGDLKRGSDLLMQARSSTVSNPLPLTWALFLVAYLTDDLAAAALSVDRMPGDYDVNVLARALLAARRGNMALARATLAPLQERRSVWLADPRALFSRFMPARDIVERLGSDLDAILADGTGPAASEKAALR
ncbi:hypothetical protein [Rhodoplanes roseus]|uniref:Uncharacterized protein n=1 Tax=Rhodoplanes roseus TaxID=29409 RepID=A0A327L0E9_9BRAD|nr:hypothetical protein [Rhodoplanes roseus]RAI42992.1 hypothetical protein CH341_16630 [Rhodoplanes roseus]